MPKTAYRLSWQENKDAWKWLSMRNGPQSPPPPIYFWRTWRGEMEQLALYIHSLPMPAGRQHSASSPPAGEKMPFLLYLNLSIYGWWWNQKWKCLNVASILWFHLMAVLGKPLFSISTTATRGSSIHTKAIKDHFRSIRTTCLKTKTLSSFRSEFSFWCSS